MKIRRQAAMPSDAPRGWLLLLSAYLLVWVPLNFAVELASVMPSLGVRGAPAVAELIVHASVAALAFAAGWSIRAGNDDALRFAAIAVTASTFTAIQSLFWSALPSQTMPGDHVPLALLYVAHAGAWLWYLKRRARVSR